MVALPNNKTGTEQASFTRLQELIQGLPRELFDQIQENVFEVAFCPGFAFPHRQGNTGTYEWEGKIYDTTRPELLTVSRAVREEYQWKIFSENLFVFSPGTAKQSLGLFSDPRSLPIHRLHASFSYRDLGEDWGDLIPIRESPVEEDYKHLPWPQQKLLVKDFRREIDTSYHEAQSKLVSHWTSKYCWLRRYPLKELTLDFTECYGAYNIFLGTYAALIMKKALQRTVPAASLQPLELRIIAPDERQKLQITRLLLGIKLWQV
ncbi:MAG: hypothetical protein LQ337_007886 [Flavoplaca oasis]|nr:MAG: hypothetical protein LQ337_007886 [Flavoplaca oasis]